MGDKTIKTKVELYAMLAEAVRNTQPQPVDDPQPEPKRNTRPSKRETPSHETRPTPKRRAKIKSVRTSANRKRQP
jgi:hypothetical protein